MVKETKNSIWWSDTIHHWKVSRLEIDPTAEFMIQTESVRTSLSLLL